MVTAAEVSAGLTAAEAIVNAIIKVAPAIERGVVSSIPYIQAIAGLIGGKNATAEEIDAVLARINAEVDLFLSPLPPDDGSTTT
ncbi:hypothetical protein Nwi_1186 [Nitrobacter winogradskyi Nb-255]|uniref:Uncharacterized protein n=1 Tax=Nitrobacter winogradskyi (strain ATCC 25391 / DSM 10237 / CIP 104748 / NCIMB 11846 / Nb-255) TaxID=323098 RepID=Q3STE3_NITWN|nr:hypothetical protein [Nitrobacter winogradskyi]ABA04448.1 hypothetical protein Nwi_1186 [Nitrobacter winogradskyi Nb-255]